MAANTLVLAVDSLKRKYSDQVFEQSYNTAARFFAKLEDKSKAFPFAGEGYFGPFYLASEQNTAILAEDTNIPAAAQRTEVQWRVRPGQFVGFVDLSWVLKYATGGAEGGFNGGEVKRALATALIDTTKNINQVYAGTHGTGRLGQVLADGSNTFTCKFGGAGYAEPWGHHMLRPNMRIKVFADDTGSGTDRFTTARKITKIVKATRTITYDGSDATVSEDDSIYRDGTYGAVTVANGLNGLIDDATVLTTIHNQSRNTYEELKSTVIKNASSLDQLSEDDVLKLLFVIGTNSGQNPDILAMNRGICQKFVAFLRPDRRVVSDGYSPTKGGFQGDLGYAYGPEVAKVWVLEDILPRTLYAITSKLLWRFTAKRLDWLDRGGADSPFFQGADSGGYKTTDMALMVHLENIGTPAPWAHGKRTDLSDSIMCGTQFGGTDV